MKSTTTTRPLWAENADIELRKRRMTQTELAKQIGLSRVCVSSAINGKRCSDATKRTICNYLRIEI
ncbi:MAG: helix-turn-helix domain-containing protein [bacterium]|nr:helix-turn-helix domain-containing protein [bacterium]